MGRDWNEPVDRGPSIDDRESRGKKRGGKRSFVIERRFVGDEVTWLCEGLRLMFDRDRMWHVHRRYRTEKARANAMDMLQRRVQAGWRRYEYRLGVE